MKSVCMASAIVLLASVVRAAEPVLAIDLGGGATLEMVLIAKGAFRQGSPSGERGRGDDESTRHVTITEDFYCGKTPVTVGQFARFVGDTGYTTEAERGASGGFGFDGTSLAQRKEFTWRNPGFRQTDAHPVTLATYDDALAFARWLARKASRKVTLPTEAQWEYACRAGTTTRYYSGGGDEDLPEIAWYRANAGDGARPVGRKRPNAFGLYDCSGNVYQWCLDWYGPYEGQDVKDPLEVRADRTRPARRVLRGGSWLKDAPACRSAARWRNTPGSRNADNGFRVVASVGAVVEREDAGRVAPAPPLAALFGRPIRAGALDAMAVSDGLSVALGVCCVAAFILVAAILIARLARRSPGGDGYADTRSSIRGRSPYVEPADDGFWLYTPGVATGAVVTYRCLVEGERLEDSVVVEAGERQFVYTGGRPADIALIQGPPPAEEPYTPGPYIPPIAAPRSWTAPAPRPEPPAPPPRDEPFRGYPPAY